VVRVTVRGEGVLAGRHLGDFLDQADRIGIANANSWQAGAHVYSSLEQPTTDS
jgi:hypothetical protein